MNKFFDPQIFKGRGARVGILVECDRDPKLWSTYT